MRAPGWNPMRWDCTGDGCFNVKCRPKIEVFSDCFPRRISFGDVDAMVEIGGAFCVLEWKGKRLNGSYPELGDGQRRSLTAFTLLHSSNVVFVVNGDPEKMLVDSFQKIFRGEIHKVEDAGIDELKRRIKAWAEWAE